MKDLIQDRIHIAHLAHNERRIFNYLEDFMRYSSHEIIDENEKAYIIRLVTGKYSFDEINLTACQEAFLYFKYFELADTCSYIKQITLELETDSLPIFLENIKKLQQSWVFLTTDYKSIVKELKLSYDKKTTIPVYSNRNWHQSSCVFHATKMEYVLEQLESGRIEGRTTQRFWEDGRRRKENEEGYEDSFWMKGISTTRSLDFARGWGGFIFVLDLNKIKENRPVVPYAWNYLIKDSKYPQFRSNNKKETEEYVVLSKQKRTYRQIEDPEFKTEYGEAMKSNDPDIIKIYQEQATRIGGDIKKPEGYLDLNKCLKGVFIMSYMLDIYGADHPTIQKILNHPKFMGILEK